MKGVLNTNLARASNKYIARRNKLTVGELYLKDAIIASVYAELFEQILLFDRVSISLGPMDNTAIAALAMGFGDFKELERAIDLETIEIILPQTLTIVNSGPFGRGEKDPSLLWGQPPVVAGRIHQEDLGDPEKALLDGLSFANGFNDGEKRKFARRIADSVKLGPINNDAQAVKMIMDAYDSDLLRSVGMPFIGNSHALDFNSRLRMQELVSEVDKMLFVAENDYGVYGLPSVYNLAKDSISKIEDALDVQRSTDFLLENLQLPNLRLLFAKRKASFIHAMKIRETSEGVEFRKWIFDNSNPVERQLLIKRYTEAIDKPTGFITRLGGQVTKGVFMNIFGKIPAAGATLAGAYLGGVVGGPVGVAVGAIAGLGVEVGGGIIIDKLVGPFSKGFTPKLFVNRIEQLNQTTGK